MKKASLLVGLLSLTTVLQACMGNPPLTPTSTLNFAADERLLVNKDKCTENSLVLASVTDSKFSWTANKGLSTNSALDIAVIGTTELAGCIYTVGNSLEGGSAGIVFRPKTTTSFNSLRDSRIIQYIFGYDIPEDPEGSVDNSAETGILQFTTQSITGVGGTGLTLPAGIGETIKLKVTGVLQIAGFRVPVEIPVAFTKTDKGFNATNAATWSLNIRGGSQATNTLGLDQRVAELLALIVNGTLQDLIEVKFSVDFVDLCAK